VTQTKCMYDLVVTGLSTIQFLYAQAFVKMFFRDGIRASADDLSIEDKATLVCK
jgi:hypothetical protein